MPRTGPCLAALIFGLSVGMAAADDRASAAYRTTLLNAAAPGPVGGRFLPLGGWAAAPGTDAGLPAAAAARPELGVLAAALDTPVARALLAGDDPLTLLAPTDAAFAALPAPRLEALRSDPALLAGLLRAHLVAGHLTARELAGRAGVTTLDGRVLRVERRVGMRLGGGRVILADVAASGGVIHLVDCVLTLPCR
jgi:uncharacterized surface protein with fasciclin (FAS1) repeats